MGDFEQSRHTRYWIRNPSAEGRALSPLNLAQRGRDYAQARATELLPDIEDEAGLVLREGVARQRLDAAVSRYARAMEADGLEAQIQELEAKRAARLGNPSLPEARSPELDAARQDAGRCREDHARVTAELAACRDRVRAGEQELKRRFGLTE